ncbi:expansin-like protein 5, partial [Saccoglossus kowalevskii]
VVINIVIFYFIQTNPGCTESICDNGLCEYDCNQTGFICKCTDGITGENCDAYETSCIGEVVHVSAIFVNMVDFPTSGCTLTPFSGELLIGMSDFQNSAVCGSCYKLIGDTGTVIAKVVSDCGVHCNSNEDMIVPVSLRDIIASGSSSPFQLSAIPVECPGVGNVKYQVQSSSSSMFYMINVYDNAYPIESTYVWKDSQWISLIRTSGLFSSPSEAAQNNIPFDVKVVSTTNSSIQFTLNSFDTVPIDTGTQFESC